MTYKFIACVAIAIFMQGCASPQKKYASDAELAKIYYEKALYSDAERVLLKLSQQMPDDYDINFRLGNIYVRTGQFPAAEARYQACIDIDPAEPKGWYNMALLRVKQAVHLAEEGHRQSASTDEAFSHQFVILRDGLIKAITGK